MVASAASASVAASRKVVRIPSPTASGGDDITSVAPTARANTAAITDAPAMRPRYRARPSIPETTPRRSAGAPSITDVLFAAWKSA